MDTYEKYESSLPTAEAVQLTASNAQQLAHQVGGRVVQEHDDHTGKVHVGLNVPTLDGEGFRVSENEYLVKMPSGAYTKADQTYFETHFKKVEEITDGSE